MSSGGGWSGGSGGGGSSLGGKGGGGGALGGGGGGAAGGHSGGGSGGPGGPMASKYAERSEANENQMRYYAASLAGLMAIFVLFHLVRVWARKAGVANKHVFAPFHSVSR